MLFSSCIKTEEKIMLRSGIDFSRVDSTVRPQDDFYRHVNGTWLKEFELPKDKSRYATFTVLREKAREDVKKIIEEASKTNSLSGSDNQKIGDLYQSYMDTLTLEETGIQNILPELEKINEISNTLDQKTKDDIKFSYERVRKFAEAQLKNYGQDFEVELSKGLYAGQKLIPVNTAGCYIPGGRYAHIASAVMLSLIHI